MSRKIEALVVGAGPVGLSMAAVLAAQDIRLRVIDSAADRVNESRAIGIQARTLEHFELMGIVDQFLELGHQLRGVTVYGATGRKIGQLDFEKVPSRYPFLLTLPQSETERILGDHLCKNGVEVERRTTLVSFEQSEAQIAAQIQSPKGDEEHVFTDWLLGCDGARSKVRDVLNLKFGGKTFDLHFLLGDVRVESELEEDHAHIFGRARGLLAFFPYGNGQYRLVADNPPEYLRSERKPTLKEWQDIADERSSVSTKLSDLGWTTYFRVNSRMAEKLRDRRAFILGDAAHIHSPALAQGMNTGIQDACNLGWKLALVQRCIARERLLDSFEQERMPVEHGVLKMTGFTQQMITAENPANRFLRDALLPVLSKTQIFQAQAAKTVSETAVQYRHSRVVEDHYLSTGPHAGDFAPNATVLRPARKDQINLTSLFGKEHVLLTIDGLSNKPDLLEKLQPTLDLIKSRYGRIIRQYLISPDEQYSLGAELLIDADRQLAQSYGLSALYLIRPDGYVAFRCQAWEPTSLMAYLDKYFVPW